MQERLTAYAGMLDWEPLDLDEEEPKEKTLDDLNEECVSPPKITCENAPDTPRASPVPPESQNS